MISWQACSGDERLWDMGVNLSDGVGMLGYLGQAYGFSKAAQLDTLELQKFDQDSSQTK